MSNFKRYDKYKDSGIEWIGEIPEGWKITKLKYICSITMGQSPKSEEYSLEEGGLPFLQGNAEFTELYPQPKIYCDTANKFSKANDILLSVRAPVGKMNISDRVYGIGRGLCAITAQKVHLKYLWYSMNVSLEELSINSQGSTFEAVTVADVDNLSAIVPPADEQISIANFLDQKTAEIDDLIADKEKLIELLQEKRQAVITEAVTKGLNPNVKMKDSGIEWIGEIPEGWRVSKIKYEALINKKTLSENTDDDFEIDYIDIGSVTSVGEINGIQSLSFKDAPSRARRVVSEGNTIVSTVRTYLKAIAFIENVHSNLVCSTGFAVLTPLSNIVPKYLFYLMRSEKYVNEIVRRSVGVSYPAVNASDIGVLECVLPSVREQINIVEYLDKCSKRINQLTNEIELQIQKLREYRQSLIFEAVTGKIDVRDYAAIS
ncbi:Restriction modification system DNA specificity domain protein [Tepidanaerobacter acetatoxydans Re1]|uniref:Restriction modification system DNA specificity domain protein n=1 Tax=Tepidanaerobacter acetatoxydans (strain DSM 21804 / JCM 16047 / Re1) TaxID=1209989 RepID=F4LS07_TEPAE|nr:restriction endonuclease subunit S [Tepidanaerobacter acetatoxydans]AEE92346.1 restriction modification system DNA specificity domain protein [Tepidanaerobacter acetatoxydans Re1]CCP27234.1 Restriction modification system DNA specificity domain protein [Tepidanaerobacter acetatoxydans Re1]